MQFISKEVLDKISYKSILEQSLEQIFKKQWEEDR